MSGRFTQMRVWNVIAWALPTLLLLVAIGSCVVHEWSSASALADYSAHAALTDEILRQLAAIKSGQPYPASLSDLPLTFPDGGGPSMLSRFEYTSSGAACTVRTVLRGKSVVRMFPADSQKSPD